MSEFSTTLRKAVTKRARERCEYCHLAQLGQEATFHIDHVLPRSAGGAAKLENLALASVSCSLRKSARGRGVDPVTEAEEPLFNPREQNWREHFRLRNGVVVPTSPTGRATVAALQVNRPVIVAIRREQARMRRR